MFHRTLSCVVIVRLRTFEFLAGCQNTKVLPGGMRANHVMVFVWRQRSHRLYKQSGTWLTLISLAIETFIMVQPSWLFPIDINVTKPRLEEQNSLVPISKNDYKHSLLLYEMRNMTNMELGGIMIKVYWPIDSGGLMCQRSTSVWHESKVVYSIHVHKIRLRISKWNESEVNGSFEGSWRMLKAGFWRNLRTWGRFHKELGLVSCRVKDE